MQSNVRGQIAAPYCKVAAENGCQIFLTLWKIRVSRMRPNNFWSPQGRKLRGIARFPFLSFQELAFLVDEGQGLMGKIGNLVVSIPLPAGEGTSSHNSEYFFVIAKTSNGNQL